MSPLAIESLDELARHERALWTLALFAGSPFLIQAVLKCDAWRFWFASRSAMATVEAKPSVEAISRSAVEVRLQVSIPLPDGQKRHTELAYTSSAFMAHLPEIGEKGIAVRYRRAEPGDVRLPRQILGEMGCAVIALSLGVLAILALAPISPWR